MPKLSVIVPVYKAEAVLETCVASVQAQTCPDWELLLIDDGSRTAAGSSATAMPPGTAGSGSSTSPTGA